MKAQKCISNLSVAVTGLLIGATPAWASPLLDSDLASFTTLGASSESYIPRSSGERAGSHSGSAQTIASINASPGSAGLANSPPGVGAAGIGLAQALHSQGIFNPGMEAPARHSSIKGPVAETGNLPQSPTRGKRDDARRYLCAMAQANLPAAAFDPDLCKEISTPNDTQTIPTTTGVAGRPPLDLAPPPSNGTVSDRDADKLTEDLQRVLLHATLPVDSGSSPEKVGSEPTGSPIQSSSPDIATVFAASPFAQDINELAATVPEPATLALLALGLAGIGVSRKRTA